MYNEKLKEISKYLGIINGYEHYEIGEYVFRFMDYEDDEYVQYHKRFDIFNNWATSEYFYNKVNNHIKLKTFNKRPKELKGKKKIATINKDRDWKVQVFVDDNFDLYYQDNHVVINEESKIVTDERGTRIETTMNCTKCWFKFEGMYSLSGEHIITVMKEMRRASEELYVENTVADNLALERLYENLLIEYLKYIDKNC